MTGTACHMRTIRGRRKTGLSGPASGITIRILKLQFVCFFTQCGYYDQSNHIGVYL